jgi:hypothetical protein
MDSIVNLSFRYLENDYVRALRAHYLTRLRLPLDFTAIVVLAGIGIYSYQSSSANWFSIICFMASAAIAFLLFAAFIIIPPLAFRREPKFRDDYSLSFSPEGICFRTANIDSRLQWGMYSRVLIDAHSYVMYYGVNQFSVIPKRVFQSGEEQQAFDNLLTQHITHIIRRDRKNQHR